MYLKKCNLKKTHTDTDILYMYNRTKYQYSHTVGQYCDEVDQVIY